MVERSTPQRRGSSDVGSELGRRLSGFQCVRFALLFGSRAGGKPRADSDWDLAVYLSDELSPEERFSERLRLAAELEDLGRIDLVVLNDAPPLLGQRALQGRRILVQDPVAYVRFFVRTEAAAGDERYWREIHRDARKRRLEEGRFGRP
jgi:predicted nucleotidyltransferase